MSALVLLILAPVFFLNGGRLLTGLAAGSVLIFAVAGAWPDPESAWGHLTQSPVLALTLAASVAALAVYARLRRRGLLAGQPPARLLAGLVLAQLAGLLAAPAAWSYALLWLCLPDFACLWLLWSAARRSGNA